MKNPNRKPNDKYDQELVYTDCNMVGLYLSVFVRRRVLNRVKAKSF